MRSRPCSRELVLRSPRRNKAAAAASLPRGSPGEPPRHTRGFESRGSRGGRAQPSRRRAAEVGRARTPRDRDQYRRAARAPHPSPGAPAKDVEFEKCYSARLSLNDMEGNASPRGQHVRAQNTRARVRPSTQRSSVSGERSSGRTSTARCRLFRRPHGPRVAPRRGPAERAQERGRLWDAAELAPAAQTGAERKSERVCVYERVWRLDSG